MNADYFRTLFDYNYWAHRRVWDCVMSLSEEQFIQPITYSIGSIQAQVVHVVSAEWIWFSRLRGESPKAMLNPADFPNRAAIRARWDAVEGEVRAYLAALTDAQLPVVVNYTTTSGTPLKQSVWQILAHAANHSTDHRAQILAMLHQLGVAGVEQDMIFYFREQE